jgi:drug/metabolite transporter (DMT)-like permease
MWVALALICALSLATADALTKRALGGTGEYVVGWLRLMFTIPALALLLPFIEAPALDGTFYRAFASALPFEVLAFVLYIKALRASPLSLTLPFLAFTPVFLVVTAYVIAGEAVSPRGAAGILLIAAGSYLLNFRDIGEGLLAPIKAIAREKGSVMMLAVAAIYSITSSLGKVAITHSSPLFFGATYFIVFPLAYTPFALSGLKGARVSGRELRTMLLVGVLNAVMVSTHMLAMSMTKVAYMISVKRSSLIFSVLYGYVLFNEDISGYRALGVVMMFAGFVLVVGAG